MPDKVDFWEANILKCPKCLEYINLRAKSTISEKDSVDKLITAYKFHLGNQCDDDYSYIRTIINFTIKVQKVKNEYNVLSMKFHDHKLFI